MAKSKESKTVQRWGYQKGPTGIVSKIFHLKENEKVPSGWVDSPAKVKKGK